MLKPPSRRFPNGRRTAGRREESVELRIVEGAATAGLQLKPATRWTRNAPSCVHGAGFLMPAAAQRKTVPGRQNERRAGITGLNS